MVIAVDFDGTLCENMWPDIGAPNIELISYLLDEKKKGSKIILWTCRAGDYLTDAVIWCMDHGLYFDAINENVPEKIAYYGGDVRKVSADIYIDDKMSTKFDLPFYEEGTQLMWPEFEKNAPGSTNTTVTYKTCAK